MAQFLPSLVPAVDANGNTLTGAVWEFYSKGTTTPAALQGGATSATSNGDGEFDVLTLVTSTAYRALLKDASGQTILDISSVDESLFDAGVKAAINVTGQTVAGATWSFYTTGTTTPQPVYADPDLTVPYGSVVTANANGVFPEIYLDTTITYKAVLTIGGTTETIDPVTENNMGVFLDPAFQQELSPSADWDGSAGSGFDGDFGATPTDPTRTTAKPILREIEVPDRTVTDELLISFAAFANNNDSLIGGIEKVRFHCEGNTVDVTTMALRTFTRKDATTYMVPCYTVKFKKPAGAGTARYYVEAFPTDGTMQNKVLGPFTIRFQATEYDLELEVAPSLSVVTGERYQSLGAAFTYLRNNALENPRITITEAGTYDDAGAPFGDYNPVGHVTIEATAAVVIGFASEQSSDVNANWGMRTSGMWFKGNNITIDFRYLLQIQNNVNQKGHVFEGINLTNSAGRGHLWRKSTRPIVPVLGRNYYIDAEVEQMDNATANAWLTRGVIFDSSYGDIGQGAQCMVGNITIDHDSTVYATDVNCMTVVGPATATLSVAGSHNGTRTFTAKEGATTVGTFEVRTNQADFDANTNYSVSNVVDWINTLSGWTATLIDDTRRAAVISTLGNKGAAFTDLDVSTVKTLVTMFDVHSDFYQNPANDAAAGTSNNVLIYGNIGIDWVGQVMLPSGTNPAPSDIAFINNAFYNDPDNSTPYALNSAFFSQWARVDQSHSIFVHNTLCNQGVLLRDDIQLSFDGYSLLANNSIRSMRWNSAAVGTGVITNNHVHFNALGNNSPQGATGTVSLGDESTLYTSASTGNFTPAGDLLTNLKAPVFGFDLYGDTRAASDAVGAVAI